MTYKLDLTKRRDPIMPWHTILSPTPYGCADCGRWYQFARQLLEHDCEARHEA